MSIASNLTEIKGQLPEATRLVAVSKFHSEETILEAYNAGQRIFGESRVQELTVKYDRLPKDIEWHFIGHLQTNKVKYIAPFISMIQSVDSFNLLGEINKQAELFGRKIPVLMQVHIAQEEHKFGFRDSDIDDFFSHNKWRRYPNISFVGMMGMATLTDDKEQIATEFKSLFDLFLWLKLGPMREYLDFRELSMGMSDDYPIAVKQGSSIVRIGSKIFGNRE